MAATKRKVDFRNVKEGGNFRPRRRPEGDYEAKIVKVDDHTSNAGDEGWVFTVQIKGDARSTYPIYASAEEKQAWKVRKLFIACGLPVPKKLVLVDPNKLLNKTLGVVLVDDEYNGRTKSSIDEFIPVEDIQGNADDDDEGIDDDEDDAIEEEEEEVKPTKRTRRAAPEPEDDEEEDDSDDDDDEPTPRRRSAAKKAAAPTRRRQAAPEPEDDDEDDDQPPSPRRRAATKRAPAKRTRRQAAEQIDDDEDDLGDIEEL